jgi:hypothetical protein
VLLRLHLKLLIPFNYPFRVLRFNQQELEHRMVFLEQIFNLLLLVVWAGAGTYDINTAGQAFSFSETFNAADSVVTSQTAASGTIAAPNLYSNATTQLGGDKGTLAGTLSPTGVPTVTAGGSGTTATAQRTIELSVFK